MTSNKDSQLYPFLFWQSSIFHRVTYVGEEHVGEEQCLVSVSVGHISALLTLFEKILKSVWGKHIKQINCELVVLNYELLEGKLYEGCINFVKQWFPWILLLLWLIFVYDQFILPVFLECFCKA